MAFNGRPLLLLLRIRLLGQGQDNGKRSTLPRDASDVHFAAMFFDNPIAR